MKRETFLFVVIVLMIIRILAWAGLLFGVIYFLFGNYLKG